MGKLGVPAEPERPVRGESVTLLPGRTQQSVLGDRPALSFLIGESHLPIPFRERHTPGIVDAIGAGSISQDHDIPLPDCVVVKSVFLEKGCIERYRLTAEDYR